MTASTMIPSGVMSGSWPNLREELDIFTSVPSSNGAPAWSIHDPARNLYFHIDWLTFEILYRWGLADQKEIVRSIRQETTLKPTLQSIQHVIKFLQRSELLQQGAINASQLLTNTSNQRKNGWIKMLMHKYLFFRIPLWRPDRFLDKTYHLFDWCNSPVFWIMTTIAMMLGVFEISRQWEDFSSTLVNLLSWQGAVGYGITLILVKFIHELGHAYSAKRRNCSVPTMGIAFLVMFPMAYTDVNDVWRLTNKRDRISVGAAGIMTELVIAAWASLAWALMPDGPLQTSAFLLASTTWISTILINASPFMRFDGYFLLMDYLEIPNLHSRSFVMARWKLREYLFRTNNEAPEYFSKGKQQFLIVFAWFTWAYRLAMFTGIAILIYMTIPKPLGPILAFFELTWFIFMPILKEVKSWFNQREQIVSSGSLNIPIIILVGFALLLFAPWDSRVSSQGILKPSLITPIITPGAAQLKTIKNTDGEIVETNQVLMEFDTPDLDYNILAAEIRLQALNWKQGRAAMHDNLREQSSVIQAERKKVFAELIGLKNLREKYTLKAPHNGIFRWTITDLKNGQWLTQNVTIAEVIDPKEWQVDAYMKETDLERIKIGDSAKFYPEAGYPSSLNMSVVRIDRDATRILPDLILSNVYGGNIVVREQNNQLVPEVAVFRVTLSPMIEDESHFSLMTQNSIRGKLIIYGKTKPWFSKYIRSAISLFRREGGF